MNLFIENKYTRWYFNIVGTRPQRVKGNEEYFESHHIMPKSMGGSNLKKNKILLTVKEHFLVHWLLTKMCVDTVHKQKMLFAFSCMLRKNSTHQRIYTSGQYTILKDAARKKRTVICSDATREKHRLCMIDFKHSEETKLKLSRDRLGDKNPMFGRKYTDEQRVNLSTVRMGHIVSEHTRNAISDSLSGRSLSEEHRISISNAQRGKPKGPASLVVCPHCDKSGGINAMGRWHFDNCKQVRLPRPMQQQ